MSCLIICWGIQKPRPIYICVCKRLCLKAGTVCDKKGGVKATRTRRPFQEWTLFRHTTLNFQSLVVIVPAQRTVATSLDVYRTAMIMYSIVAHYQKVLIYSILSVHT